jgi:hypothetical protein
MKKVFSLAVILFLICCSPITDQVTKVTDQAVQTDFDKVVLISLDSSISCEHLSLTDDLSVKNNRDCSVVDDNGTPLFSKIVSITLEGQEKAFVIDFLLHLKKDSISLDNIPSIGGVSRDAVLLYKINDQKPSKVFLLNFSQNAIYSKGIIPCSNDYCYIYPELANLSNVFIKKGLKNENGKWR